MSQSGDEFREWLTRNGLNGYESAFEEQGYDDLRVLVRMTSTELEQLADDLGMKPGHKRKLPILVEEEVKEIKREEEEERRTKIKTEEEVVVEDQKPVTGGSSVDFPPSKNFHYFASHKKIHSRFGRDSETLGLKFKEVLMLKYNLKGWFDADNLQRITLEKLSEGIAQSCSVLLFLNDETLSSTWCVHECKEARKLGIPIIPLIDSDLQPSKQVVDGYMAQGYDWIFDEQAIQYSAQGREKSYELVAEAILRAVAPGGSRKQGQVKAAKDSTATAEQADVHGTGSPVDLLKAVLMKQYGSAEEAFGALSNDDGFVGKREWKRAVSRLLPSLSVQENKKLRKLLPKNADKAAFTHVVSADGKETEVDRDDSEMKRKDLAKLPDEVPELPPSFRRREHAQEQLLEALLASAGARSTAVTAPKSRISSQGMGGVGKTMLTAAVVRSEAVRSRFKVICWLNLSQQPAIMRLQQRLHEQLSNNQTIPTESSNTVEQQKGALEKAAANQTVLIVLDDVWDSQHQQYFDAMDPQTRSKLLVTTRIKNVLSSRGVEVELELLGLQESVELLSGVAELESVPPVCLEISQLCGRLPLCLNIVGKLIRSYGSDSSWIEEVPNLIKRDMKSLTDKGSGSNLNLQQRVIQSGLDSIDDGSAESIVALFKGFAVFAEDQIVSVAIVSVLWTSLKQQAGKLSAIVLRQWLSELLSRSILIGSVADGVGMHDIVRDFTLSAHTTAGLRQLQRQFVLAMLAQYSAVIGEDSKAAKAVREYTTTQLTHHLKGALTAPLCDDEIARIVLFHQNDDVVVQALESTNIPDVEKLAEWLAGEGGDQWSACLLFSSLAFKCRGVELAEKLNYLRSCLTMLQQHVPDTQLGAKNLQAFVLTRLWRMTPDGAESKAVVVARENDHLTRGALLEKMISWARKKDAPAPPRVTLIVGLVLTNQYRSGYAISHTRQNHDEGADMMLSASVPILHSAQKLQPGFAKMSVIFTMAMMPHTHVTTTSASTKWPEVAKLVLGGSGQHLLAVCEMYSARFHHARFVSQSQVDHMHMAGAASPVFLCKFADTRSACIRLEQYESMDAEIKNINLPQNLSMSYISWPALELLRPGALDTTSSLWGLTFNNANIWAEQVPVLESSGLRWIIEDDDGGSAWACESGTVTHFTRALIAAQLPGRVSCAEVEEFLPEVDFRPVHDRVTVTAGVGETLSTLLAMAAVNCGKPRVALRYNRFWLEISFSPLKNVYAHAHLGLAVTMDGEEEEGGGWS